MSPRRDLPSGTVSLLFADVEGSTRLLHLLGERFAPARSRLREIVRDSAAQYDGTEVDWAGDGAFLAFPRARDAVAGAIAIQRALRAEAWPADEALRLRIGIHTGEPDLGDEGYVGMDVVVAARICAAAHGDQVVISGATRDLTGELPGVSYRSLGRHRLKDVPTPRSSCRWSRPAFTTSSRRSRRSPQRASRPSTIGSSGGSRRSSRSSGPARNPACASSRSPVRAGPGRADSRSRWQRGGARAARPLAGLAPVSDPELVPARDRPGARGPRCGRGRPPGRDRGCARGYAGAPRPRQLRAPRVCRRAGRRAARSRPGSRRARDEPRSAAPVG